MVTVHKYCDGRKQLREIETGHIVLYVLWYFVRFLVQYTTDVTVI